MSPLTVRITTLRRMSSLMVSHTLAQLRPDATDPANDEGAAENVEEALAVRALRRASADPGGAMVRNDAVDLETCGLSSGPLML